MKTIRRLFGFVKPYFPRFFIAFIAMIGLVAIDLSFPKIIRFLLDDLFSGKQDLSILNLLAGAVIVLAILKGLISFAKNYLMAFVGQRTVADIRNRLYQHLQRMSISYHESHHTGEMMARVTNDVGMVQIGVSTALADTIYQSMVLVGSIVFIFLVHWKLAILTFITFPLIAWAVTKAGKRVRAASHRVQEKIADLSTVLQETISGIRIVKAFTMENYEIKRFHNENEGSFNATMKSAKVVAGLTPIVELLLFSALAIIIWYGGSEVINGHLTPGKLMEFITYVGLLTAPITIIPYNFNNFMQALAASERIFSVLDTEEEIKEAPDAVALSQLTGKVEFRNVSFGYQQDLPVLRGIDLQANPGEVVALVGPSGGGKTSLVNLLPRFYDPSAGCILVDGQDIRKAKLRSLRSQIGLVPQESILFSTTIKENIAYGRPDASEDDIIAAAKAANAHEFILGLPKGYDTLAGERGAALSGGQRQRIAIARALLRNPRILILDEATSALDTESERSVQEALERLMRERTTFIIAHRLSTVQFADKIVVLEDGSIVETGTHEQLLARNGLYKRLYDSGNEFNNQVSASETAE